MITPLGSTGADARETTHKYNTRNQLGRPGTGEKTVNGGGQCQKQQ